MKGADIVLIIAVAVLFFVSLYFAVKKKSGCGGNCAQCTLKCENEKTRVENLLGTKFGVIAFSAVSDKLLPCRAAARIPENAKSILIFTFPYKVKNVPPENISRYGAVPDYHTFVMKMLDTCAEKLKKTYPENIFECFCDNSPIPEVYAAALSGLGCYGKNGLLITEKYGTFVFIGEIVTDLYIPAATSFSMCEGCGKCMDECPVSLDKTSCVSKITQKKDALGESEANLIKKCGSVWGCDICQNVCPHNKNAGNTDIEYFISGYRERYEEDEDTENRPYMFRGTKPIKRNAEILKNF